MATMPEAPHYAEHAMLGLGVGQHDGAWRRTEEFVMSNVGLETIPVLHKTRFDAASRPVVVDRTFDDEDDRKRTGFIDRGKRRFRTHTKSSAHCEGWTSGPPAAKPPVALFSPRGSPWGSSPRAAADDAPPLAPAPAAPAAPAPPPGLRESPRRSAAKPLATSAAAAHAAPSKAAVPEALTPRHPPKKLPSPRSTPRMILNRDYKLLPVIPPPSASPTRPKGDWRPVLGIPAMRPPPLEDHSPRALRLQERRSRWETETGALKKVRW